MAQVKNSIISGLLGVLFCASSYSSDLPILILDDFENQKPTPANNGEEMKGPLPAGWDECTQKDDLKDYALVSEKNENFLRGRFIPGTQGKVFLKKITWDIDQYPLITWRWRVGAWATGSTVKSSKKEDSSASFYVSFKSGIKNYIIKYIWAVDDPLDSGYSKGKWNPAGALEALVIRSGGNLNEWQTEVRNLKEDFKKLYKKDPPSSKASGIGVLTEGDGTQTQPQADYDDIKAMALPVATN